MMEKANYFQKLYQKDVKKVIIFLKINFYFLRND